MRYTRKMLFSVADAPPMRTVSCLCVAPRTVHASSTRSVSRVLSENWPRRVPGRGTALFGDGENEL